MRKDEAADVLDAARQAATTEFRRAVAESGMSQVAVAELLGISHKALHGYVHGPRQPRADVFLAAREIARREKERREKRCG